MRRCVCVCLTSHVEISRGGVSRPCAVHGHALVLALIRFLAVFDLQRSCKEMDITSRSGSTLCVCVCVCVHATHTDMESGT